MFGWYAQIAENLISRKIEKSYQTIVDIEPDSQFPVNKLKGTQI